MKRLLEILLPQENRDAILGDLEEDYAAHSAKHGRRAARVKYSIDAADAVAHTRAPEIIAVVAGIAGGFSLVYGEEYGGGPANGIIPAVLVIAMAGVARIWRITTFRRRFTLPFIAFEVMMLLFYVVVAAGAPVSLWGHAWRLALVVALGCAFGLPLAVFSRPGRLAVLPIALVPVALAIAGLLLRPRPPALTAVARAFLPFSAYVRWPGSGWWMFPADLMLWSGIALALARLRRPARA